MASDEVITEDEQVHFGAQKAVQCLLRPTHDRLVFIKRGWVLGLEGDADGS